MTTRRTQRRRRDLAVCATGPMLLHIFSFSFAADHGFRRAATVLIRSRCNHTDLIGDAYQEAKTQGPQPFMVDVRSVPAPRATPSLDRLCHAHTAFPSFLALLTAPAGYRPSIRLDITGDDGKVLANAYDKRQARWGDSRRALVWPRQGEEACHA